jgi:hypothetical protein
MTDLVQCTEVTKDKKTNKHRDGKIPVFRIKPQNRSNECTIKYVGYLTEDEKLGDEIVELDTPLHSDYLAVGKHAIPIKKIGMFNMLGRLYRCNIIGSHIAISSRYPLMYLNIEYERPMVSGSLFQMFFSIDMDKEHKKSIKELKSYVNLKFAGRWVRHIDCDDEFTQNYDQYFQDMLEDEALKKFYHSDETDIVKKRDTMTQDQIASWVDEYVNSERVFYDKFMRTQEDMTFRSIHDLRDNLVEMCMSDRFHKFLFLAMKARDLHRRKNYGIEEDATTYIVPQIVTKMDDVIQKMIDDDELIRFE